MKSVLCIRGQQNGVDIAQTWPPEGTLVLSKVLSSVLRLMNYPYGIEY